MSSFGFRGKTLTDQTRPVSEEGRYYQYDPIGNRTTSLENRQQIIYEGNQLNQYKSIKQDSLQALSYDPDGNLLGIDRDDNALSNTRYIYNGENRLILVTPSEPKNGDFKMRIFTTTRKKGREKDIHLYRQQMGANLRACFYL